MRAESDRPGPAIQYQRDIAGINWGELKAKLTADSFDNGRTPEQLRCSFANSHLVCFALAEGNVIGKARILSDGVCNAYLVDVWTFSPYRRQGIASEMIRQLLANLSGQHVYLQSDEDTVEFYRKLGFGLQSEGMSKVVGTWLNSTPE